MRTILAQVLAGSLVGVLAVVSLTSPAGGQTLYVSDIGSDNGMVVVHPVPGPGIYKSTDGAVPAEGGPLRLRFYLENVSDEKVVNVVIGAHVFTAAGQIRGSYGFDVRGNLSAGEKKYYQYRISKFQVFPGDQIILALEEVTRRETSWQIFEADPDYGDPEIILHGSQLDDGSGRPYKASDPCLVFCEAAEARCHDATCKGCGVQEFSCSCGADGTRTYICKCVVCQE